MATKGRKKQGLYGKTSVNIVSEDCSFLEMLDVLNEQLIHEGKEAVAFDHDCREGICGACSLTINGNPHGPEAATTTCQLHMRKFKDAIQFTLSHSVQRHFL
jgi:succinate dehydrogenase / fumarate reductase iron-sulfur subunit